MVWIIWEIASSRNRYHRVGRCVDKGGDRDRDQSPAEPARSQSGRSLPDSLSYSEGFGFRKQGTA